MIIDLVFVVLVIMAIVKGYRRGLIIAVFSIIALIVGLAAAIKLSAVVASFLSGSVNVSAKWLPVLAFLIVFIAAVLLVRLCASMLQATVEMAMLGWVNRLGGILIYAVLYFIVYSVVLFYAEKMHLLKPATIAASHTYGFIQPWGPKVIDGIGRVIPFFRDMFHDLEIFFERMAHKG